jgi:hypothetical protein
MATLLTPRENQLGEQARANFIPANQDVQRLTGLRQRPTAS